MPPFMFGVRQCNHAWSHASSDLQAARRLNPERVNGPTFFHKRSRVYQSHVYRQVQREHSTRARALDARRMVLHQDA